MIIGLTGGIGSGKTIVAKLFETMGCIIYNSDERAKELYFNKDIKQQVIALLGKEAYINDVELNKAFIAQVIFSDKDKLQQLNAIIHPAVKQDFKSVVNQYSFETLIIKETALLFEENISKEVDVSILVTAPIELKIERVMKRNHLSRAEVEKRMSAQWTDEQKIPLATYVIINDGKEALIPQVLAVINQLRAHA
jgi:dephospho-CoA kinase